MSVPSDIEIARAAELKPIEAVAERVGIPDEALVHYGRHIAKLDLGWIAQQAERPSGRLVLVTAINPTPAGEGKTTTTVGLGDGLNRIGKKAVIALREPSLGPCFGMKGGAAGGGYAQVVPMEQINLHFTGDFHAIGSAHNLLSALLDNHIYWGNPLGLDERRISWRRAIDMNDRCTAADRVVAGRRRQRLSARGRLRHHRRLRSHGRVLPRHRPRGPRAAARQDDRGLHPRPQAGARRRPAGGRRHDRAAQGRPGAQPGADAGRQPRLRSWRPVRQHRPRLQLGDGDAHGTQARRLCGDGGGLRRRPRCREVLRHQVPQGRA